jgi:hypothetical protein
MTRLLTFLGAVAVHTLLLSRPTVSAQLGRRPTSRSMMTAGARGRPPPPPPPNPCLGNVTNAPKFHITNMGTGPHDANAIFQYKGVWHLMHQANWTDWCAACGTPPSTRLPAPLPLSLPASPPPLLRPCALLTCACGVGGWVGLRGVLCGGG